MGSTYLLTILLLSYTLIICNISFTAGTCFGGNFTKNSTYDHNLNSILSSLASNVAANGGFYNATIGQEPNKIYAVAFCGGVFSTESCVSCVNAAEQNIATNCPDYKKVSHWETIAVRNIACTVSYANRSLGTLEIDPLENMCPYPNDLQSDRTEFNKIWENLLIQLVTKASKESSGLKFATGEANLSVCQKIYAMVQCIPDLSENDCKNCLHRSVAAYQSSCGTKQGWTSGPSCYFRWDLNPFYEITASPPTASTSPPQLSTKGC